MWTRALLKENAKIAFKRNYWTCVIVSLIAGFLGVAAGGASLELNFESEAETSQLDALAGGIPEYIVYVLGAVTLIAIVVGLCIALLVSNVVEVGCKRYFLENREHQTDVGQLFYGFRNGRYGSNVYVLFMRDLYIFGHFLLLIIPGIIKAYSYALVPYILAENSKLDKDRVLKLSSEMMNGYKMELFVLELSFIGWNILNSFTWGILGIFYVNPYIHATKAEFYSAIKADAVERGIVLPGELPGVYYQEQTVEW